ncbi:UNVERIFIED_CONTAM: hypothetical protein Scaly_1227200 [Sesamum calycinum]|uniref:Uncharacterized protein n=1 Tax=Sesamum calycinum TaxID=2727403 RepID=A0AAW2Q4B8_9LAMI
MAAWTAAARQAANLARLSTPRTAATSSQASLLIQRRGLAGGGVRDFSEAPSPPALQKMKQEKKTDLEFVIVSLSGWGLLIFGGYKIFAGGKKDKKGEKVGEAAH